MGLFNFRKDVRGNVGIMIALAMVPLLMSAGAAIDLLNRNNTDTTLQIATDSAALAGYQAFKKYGKTRAAEAKIKATVFEYLKSNGADKSIESLKIKDYGWNKSKEIFFVEMAGTVPTSFMRLGGIKSLDASSYSEVNDNTIGLELALVLDTTLSMSRMSRMSTLKRSATKLINILFKDKSADQYLKVGLVPFANYVTVGLGKRRESWIEVPDDYQDPPSCYIPGNVGVKYGTDCTTTTHPYTSTSCSGGGDGEAPSCITTTTSYNSTTCNVIDPGVPGAEVCNPGAWHRWHGIVGSRVSDTIISGGELYPGPLDISGPDEITDLTDHKGSLISGINRLTPAGETYIPTGLLWGWNLVDSAAPFSTAKTKAEMEKIKGVKAIVLMTDGFTTRSPTGKTHDGSNAAESDAKTAEMCNNIKKDDIVIYTVAFMVQKASTKKMLADCASEPEYAFDAQQDEALEDAFEEIAGSLRQLYLSR